MTSLAAVIPATDGRPTWRRCVESIEAALAPPEEIVLVDGPRGVGPAAARNEGARRARADVVVFVDSDVEVHADAFVRIRNAYASDAQLVAVFGSYDDDPGGGGLVSDFRNLLHHHVHQGGAGGATTFWTGLGAIRRDVFLAEGGFDDARFPQPSVEDIELGMRLAAHGHKLVLDPTIQGKHLKRWTFGGMVHTDLLRRGAPWVRLLLDDGRQSTALNLGWRHRLSAAACIVLLPAVALRSWSVAGACIAAVVILNGSFYLLLRRRRGWTLALAGVPLHLVHHLLSAAAVPTGAALYVHGRLTRVPTRSA
jgi:GT2 family glycosyltransferase